MTLPRRGLQVSRRHIVVFALVALGLMPLQLFVLQRIIGRPPGEVIKNIDSELIDDVNTPHEPYSSIPPTSGPHVANGAAWGVHVSPIPNEIQVANLIAGGVIVQYNCVHPTADCAQIVDGLTLIAERYPDAKLVIAPAPALADARIAMTALNWLEKLRRYRERPVVKFIEAHLKISSK